MKLMGCHLESKDSKIRQKQVQLSGSCESTWNLAQPPIGRPTSRLDKFRSHGAAFEKEPSQDYMLPSPLVVNQSSPQLPPHSCIPQLAPVQRQTRHDSLQSSAEPTLWRLFADGLLSLRRRSLGKICRHSTTSVRRRSPFSWCSSHQNCLCRQSYRSYRCLGSLRWHTSELPI
jgi:hypothetical protein